MIAESAPAKRLLLVERGGGEVARVGRQLVGVAVHVEDGEFGICADEQRVIPTVRGEGDGCPAHLALVAGINACPQGLCDQLRAEADAEDRTPGGEHALYQRGLGGEERMAIGLVGGHRPAQDDEPPDPAQVTRRRFAASQIEVAVVHAELA